MKFRYGLLILLATGINSIARAQSLGAKYTLSECIELAWKNSLDIQLASISYEQANNNLTQAKWSLWPTLSFSGGQFVQSGRSIDRFTNAFVQNTVASNSFQFSSNVLLYGGGQLRNNIKSAEYTKNATASDYEYAKQSIALQVGNLFLQILQAKELVKTAEANKASTQSQVNRAQRLVDEGVTNEGALLNLKAQLSNDHLTVINAKNQEDLALNNLKILLQITESTVFDIEIPSMNGMVLEPYPYNVQAIFDTAVVFRKDVQASMLRLQAADYRHLATKGGLFPTLTLGVNLNTVYSDNAKEISGANINGSTPIGFLASNMNEIVLAPKVDYTLRTIGFGAQLRNNFGQSFGLNLNVPLFNNLQSSTAVKNASLGKTQAEITLQRTKNNLYNEILQAHNAHKAALERYKATKLSYEAQELNYQFVEKRFDAGQSNQFELQVARSSLQAADFNLISARYELIFRTLVLDFYLGRTLALN